MEANETKTEGTPSPQLQRMQAALEANKDDPNSILDTSGGDDGFEGVTDAVPEKGAFQLVGGYVDDNQVLYNRVQLRAMGGNEEDLLGNDSVSVTQRMNGIMASCTTSLVGETPGGDAVVIDQPGLVTQAIHRMPSGTRTHLLIALRRATHWRRHKDAYEMIVKCPNRRCQKEKEHTVDLSTLELFQPPDPRKLVHEVELFDAEVKVQWRVAHGGQDETLTVISRVAENEILSYMILVRLASWDGDDCRLGSTDLLDAAGRKIKLSPRAAKMLKQVKNLSSGDREELRESFLIHEPAVDTDLEFECPACKVEFTGMLDVGQKTFFFPSATSRRSKRKSSS